MQYMSVFLFRVLPLLLIILSGETFGLQLENEGGTIGLNGSITDAPCNIDVGDQNQAIEFGAITTGRIIHEGGAFQKPVKIGLTNCVLSENTKRGEGFDNFEITFDGSKDGNLFGVIGAKGIGIRIYNNHGEIATPGKPMLAQRIVEGDVILHFYIKLVSDGENVRPGDWRSIINFKVDYS